MLDLFFHLKNHFDDTSYVHMQYQVSLDFNLNA